MEQISDNIRAVGRLLKPHGVKGEMTMQVDNSALFDTDYIIVPLDGLYVPFFIEGHRGKSDNVDIVKIEDIDSDKAAQKLIGAAVYLKIDDLDEDDSYGSLEGYVIFDGDKRIGVITAIDDQTENVLLEVTGEGGTVLIPVVYEWIEDVNDADRVIKMSLPEGLVEVN